MNVVIDKSVSMDNFYMAAQYAKEVLRDNIPDTTCKVYTFADGSELVVSHRQNKRSIRIFVTEGFSG